MDCLHCGKPLPLLKKLGDARFCSSDHERAWRSSLQETMLDRLRVSAEQFRRAVQKDRAARATPVVEESEPVPAAQAQPSEPAVRTVAVSPGASQSFPLSTDAHLVVPVESALVVAAQSS